VRNEAVVTLKLPSNFEFVNINNWLRNEPANATADDDFVTFTGGWNGATISNVVPDGERTVRFTINLPATTSGTRGSILFTPQVRADRNARYGDVVLSISGTNNVSSEDITVAKYQDWGAVAEIEEVKELVAGKVNDVVTTALITVEETVPGALIENREVEVGF
ncbi:hypothetical protein HA451_19775, partial [Aeromonas veronii]|nr:hypothetical protein [Aeromonas veronii]